MRYICIDFPNLNYADVAFEGIIMIHLNGTLPCVTILECLILWHEISKNSLHKIIHPQKYFLQKFTPLSKLLWCIMSPNIPDFDDDN